MAGTDEKAPQPSPAETFLFYSIVKNLRTRPDIDWEGVAKDNGFKNADTAKVRYGQVKRKLKIDQWEPPVKPQPKASGSGVGKTEPDTTPGKPSAATGAGVKKRTPASARKKTAAAAKGKSKATVIEDSDDSESESKAMVKTPKNALTGAAAATPISIGSSSTPTTGDSNAIRPVTDIDAVLARLSPTPIGRAQAQIDLDSFVNSLQGETAPANNGTSSQLVVAPARNNNNRSVPLSILPPASVNIPGSVYCKTAIPVRGLGNAWSFRPVSVEEHSVWFGNLSIDDQNRFMEAAVQYHFERSEAIGRGEQQHREQAHQTDVAAQFKGKKLADIPYHPGFQGNREEEDEPGVH
ncbi:hypothetical protein QBC40DRAFT_311888 [Triangularia verruculosa]|uniref:Uncharacterized protein n=1 Tax=Triangularia verruculosa TaxID=2587418 RepID=A0AAN6XTW8_9PEZI|nr:hypothetical protein QBC40DRAFT_311888 [Triangularia verruculosa]